MPMPWKKAKVSRISRIMADLQQQKPRSSMVVETGFPTSIVDLFVKNCDRLKKSRIKKDHKNQNQPPLLSRVVEELLISDFSSSRNPLAEEPVHINSSSSNSFETLVAKIPNQDSDESLERCGGGDDSGSNLNKGKRGVFLCRILMIFAAVILALSTKILAIGITISALLLLFLECIGKHFLIPNSVCNSVQLNSNNQIPNEEMRGLIIVQEKEEEDELLVSVETSSFHEKIQMNEARLDAVAREQILNHGKRWGTIKYDSEVIIHEKEHTHRSEIRRRIIKKLVPKKLRHMKKAKKGKEREADVSSEGSSCGEGKLWSSVDSGEQCHIGCKWKLALLHLVGEEMEEENRERETKEEKNQISYSTIELQAKSEVVGIKKEGKNRGFLFVLLMVLAGLIGGRLLAFGLTLFSSFIILVWRVKENNRPSMSSQDLGCCFVQ